MLVVVVLLGSLVERERDAWREGEGERAHFFYLFSF
jgi:hypothetical protein